MSVKLKIILNKYSTYNHHTLLRKLEIYTPTCIQGRYNKILKSVKCQLDIWSIFNIDES